MQEAHRLCCMSESWPFFEAQLVRRCGCGGWLDSRKAASPSFQFSDPLSGKFQIIEIGLKEEGVLHLPISYLNLVGLVQLETVVLVRFYWPFNKGAWGDLRKKKEREKKSHRMLTPAPSVGTRGPFFILFYFFWKGGVFFWWHLAACGPPCSKRMGIKYNKLWCGDCCFVTCWLFGSFVT